MTINDEYTVDIIRRNNEGDGVTKIDDLIVFVKGALEGETVKIKIDKVEKNYARSSTFKIINQSSNRRDAICPYYSNCGGCNLMQENYESQLNFKKEKIKSILNKISNETIDLDIVYDKEYYYRNKVTLKVENDKIGYYKNKTNELVEISKCFIASDEINNILEKLKIFIKKNKNNNIRKIMIRSLSSKNMIVLDDIKEELVNEFINIFKNESIYIKDKCITGNEKLIQKQNDLLFYVSPKSFFQVNKNISEKLYEYVSNNVKCENVLDLYSGTGTISIIVSKTAKMVTGIEVNKDAVKDANENLKLNNIKNVKFICGKVEDNISDIKNIDTIILDPPRSGSDKKSLKTILQINPNKIIYISCNPVTLARDYNTLKDNYIIKQVKAFDMFPNTNNVETVMILEKKDV